MTRVSDLDLERFLTDDFVDDDERVRIAAAIATDATLSAHVAERRLDQQAWAALHRRPPTVVPTMTTRWRGFWRVLRLSPLVAVAAAVLVVVTRTPDTAGVATRGAGLVAHLLVRRDAVVFVHAQQPLRAGDAVRIEVELDVDDRCSVIGVDARNARSLLYDDIAVASGTTVLPDALVLDDSSGDELLAVVCGAGSGADVVTASGTGDFDDEAVVRRWPRARLAVLPYSKEPTR